MSGVEMKFVSDAAKLLADYEKIIAKEGSQKKAVTDTAKAIANRRKEQAAMAREAIKLEKQVATPLEKYKGRLVEIDKLRKSGLISEESHRRAAVKAWKDSGMAAVQAEKAGQKEQIQRERTIELGRRQTESAQRRARYEEALGQKRKQILSEIETPQQRYNAKLRDLNKLLRAGKLTQDQYSTAVRKTRQELVEQAAAGQKATALGGITSMVASWVSVGTAIAAATAAVRDYQAEKEAAAQRAIEASRGMGSLAQLADTPQEHKKLQDKARELHLSGAVASEDEGARVVFALESANSMKQFDLFKQAGSAKLFADLAPLAKAAATLKTSMGEKETGTTRDIVSKSLGASKFSPASAEQLLEASARSGGSAGALGFSDESVLAGTAIMATATGSASEGGTTMASLLRSLDEKRGELTDEKGEAPKTLKGALLAIKEKNLSSEELKKLLGRSEAVRAYRGLTQNMPRYEEALAATHAAQRDDLVGQKLRLHEADPHLMGAKMRVQSQARNEQSLRQAGSARNISEAYLLDSEAADREAGYNEAMVWGRDKLRRWRRSTALPVGPGQDINFLQGETYGTGGTRGPADPVAEKYLDAAEKLQQAADKIEKAFDKVADKQLAAADRLTQAGEKQAAVAEQQTRAADKRSHPNPAVSHADHQ